MEEVWKDVVGYEGLYQVSSLGSIKGLKRVYKQFNKLTGRDNYREYPEQFMYLDEDKDGYLSVRLSKDGKRKKFLAHRLVALHFIDNPLNKPEVNHMNGDKQDNSVSNLEWATTSENQQHAHDNKLYDCQKGERNGQSKLTEVDVREIHRLHSLGSISQQELADQFKVQANAISRVLAGKRWRHVYEELY